VRTEPFVWLLFCIIAAIVLSIALRRRVRLTSGWYVLLTLGVLVVIILLFANDQHRPSRVDVSPLAELNTEQVEHIESVIIRLEEHDTIRNFSAQSFQNDFEGWRIYRFYWLVSDRPQEWLRISVTIYADDQRAMEVMQSSRSRGQPYTHIANANNTGAMLGHSFMPRHYGLAIPTPNRHLRTSIQIGNAHIRLFETLPWYNLRDSDTSRFIAMLAEVLQEEWDGEERERELPPPLEPRARSIGERYRLRHFSFYVPAGMIATLADNRRGLGINLTAADENRAPYDQLRFGIEWRTDVQNPILEPSDMNRSSNRYTYYTMLNEGTMTVGGLPAVYMEVSRHSTTAQRTTGYGIVVRVIYGYFQYDIRFITRDRDDFDAYLPVVMEIIESARFYN